jgi:hypothetical protein
MPDRIIRERITTSPELDSVSPDAERLFTRAMVKADDQGDFEATPEILLASCFPRKVGTLAPADVARWRDELARAGLWTLYVHAGRMYGAFVTWAKHQRRRYSKPKHPLPTDPDSVLCSGFSARRGAPRFAANGGGAPLARAPARVESRESRVEIGGNLPQTPSTAEPGEKMTDPVDVKALLRDVTTKLAAPPPDPPRGRRARGPDKGREK